ncbi:MAG: BspA family leucine-rich repeat surface protein, partial [Bacteroidales bacterium]|nr:BspA family leucine-rich repeat surface protein [Bacteroidales bacterium]
MKKHFLAILVLMALCLFGGNAKADSKTYSFYSPGDNTLSFYYSADGTIPRRHQDGNNGGTYYYIGGKWEHHYNGDTYADNIYKVVFDASLKNSDVKYIQNWLTGLKNLKSVTGWENIKPTNTTNLQGMFKGCTSLTSLGDFYNFNTSNVKTMESMFEGCTSLRYVDLSGLNLKKLESMTNMFKGCTNLRVVDLRGCSTASLTYAEGTFYGCSNLETIFATTSWISPKNSNNGLDMFTGCTKLRAKEEYNPSRTSSYYASVDYYFTIDGRDSYPVEGYARYYKGTLTFYYDKYRSTTTSYALEKIAGDYVLNSGTDEPGWLKKHKNNITTVIFDESFKNIAPKSCSHWFFECNNLTTITNIENLKLYNCATVDYMFSGCTSLVSLDLSKIDLSQNKVLKNFSYMFSNCSNLKNLKLPQRDHLCTTCSMKAMFKECTKLTNIDFMQGFSTKYATDMSYMFAGTGITQVPGDCLILLECEDMSWMFYNCQYLKTVKLGHNVAASPQNTNNMFANCGKLEYVFLGDSNHDFSMAKVTNIGYMFSQCTQLKAIFVGSEWNTSKVTNSSYCFQGCSNLMGMNGTKFSSTNTNKTYARLDKDGQKGYLSTYQSTITFKECTFGKKTYKADEPLTISDPTKKGYVFQGWTGTGLSSYTKKLTLPIYSSGDREYTANWLKDLSYSYYYIQATPSSYTYNGKAITYTVTLDGKELKEGTDYTVGSSPGTIKDAKTYNLTIVGNEANGYIYSKQLSFTISPAKVTIKPDAISKTYGDADPAKITYTYTGFCGSDGFTSAPVFKRATG